MTNRFTPILFFFCILLASQPLSAQFFTERFDGGLPETWTATEVKGNNTASSNWIYTTIGPQGEFANATGPLNSTSATNGWMIFDSDLNCRLADQEAWLISPAIDGSGKSRLVLIFETVYAKFNSKVFVRVGSDMNNLSSWESIEVFPGLLNNDDAGVLENLPGKNPVTVQLDITDLVSDPANFHFAFQYLSDNTTLEAGDIGCGYNWQIDDVLLSELNVDLALENPIEPPNYATPLSQVDSFFFGTLVRNKGFETRNNFGIDVNINKALGAGSFDPVFSSTAIIPSLEPDSSSFVLFEEGFMASDSGIYILQYGLTDESEEEDKGNNNITQGFLVTSNIFSKDDGSTPTDATQPGNIVGNTWEIGSYYFIPNDGTEATEGIFSVASENNSHQGQTVTVFLYEVAPDDITDVFDERDLTVAGFATHTFTDEENFDLFSVKLLNSENATEGVTLKGQTAYVLTIAYTPDMFVPYTTNPYFFNFSTFVKNGNWFTGGFGEDITAIARMRVRSLNPTSNEVTQLEDNQVQLFPNPAKDEFSVSFQLKQASDVELNLMDLTGKSLQRKEFKQSLNESVNWDVRNLPSGTYLMQVKSEEGFKTKKFTIQH